MSFESLIIVFEKLKFDNKIDQMYNKYMFNALLLCNIT